MKSFMDYDLVNNQVHIDTRMIKDDDYGMLEISIVLIDNKGSSSKEILGVDLMKKVKLFFEVNQGDDEEDIKIDEIPVVSAKFESVNALGEVVIRFNTSM